MNPKLTFLNVGLLSLFLLPLLTGCNGCQSPDIIRFENSSSSDIGFLLDGRDSTGTFNDQVYLLQNGDTSITLRPDVFADAQLPGEIAAFNKNRMPAIMNPVTFQEGADIESIAFSNEFFLNFTVWIVHTDLLNTVADRMTATLNGLLWADQYWRQERVGLRLGAVQFIDQTNSSGAVVARDYNGILDTTYLDQINTFVGFNPGNINIYLIRKVNNSRTRAYAQVGGEHILMGLYATAPDLLFHQIAHCFSLEDADESLFSNRNVAHEGGSILTNRKYFTEGQIYRCHVNPGSAINDTYNARPGGYMYHCPDDVVGPRCPEISQSIFTDGFGIVN